MINTKQQNIAKFFIFDKSYIVSKSSAIFTILNNFFQFFFHLYVHVIVQKNSYNFVLQTTKLRFWLIFANVLGTKRRSGSGAYNRVHSQQRYVGAEELRPSATRNFRKENVACFKKSNRGKTQRSLWFILYFY